MGKNFAMISLGCSKNLVNSEQMIWLLENAGYHAVATYDIADIAIINTCGFVDSAKAEAIENILELIRIKKDGRLKKIFVVGCLAESAKEEILDEFPEVDGLAGCGSYGDIVKLVEASYKEEKPCFFGDINASIEECGRTRLTAWYTAYVKIAEGCDNRCSYCVIPSLRGRYRSRTEEDIAAECAALASDGVKEINIIAQDITRYGRDLDNGTTLASLLKKLCAIDGISWIRLHYLYPDGITDELISVVSSEDKICKYLDLPLQHCDDDILLSMNRRGSRADIKELINKLRARIPSVVLRTTFITGLPGETEEKFEDLCDFVKEMHFERAGFFAFSPQEGTPAASMPGQIDEETAENRRALLIELQERIMTKYYDNLIGKELLVLCEGYDRYAEISFGRSFAESPDIDGKIFFKASPRPNEGDFIKIRIEENADGDLFGSVI